MMQMSLTLLFVLCMGGGRVIYSCHWAPVHITSASVVGGDNMTSYGRSYQGRVVSSARFQRSHSKLHHDQILSLWERFSTSPCPGFLLSKWQATGI